MVWGWLLILYLAHCYLTLLCTRDELPRQPTLPFHLLTDTHGVF